MNTLIALLLGELLPGDRQKVMTVCTIDVHARDVVAKLISQKASCRDFMYLLLFTKRGVFVKNISEKAIFFKVGIFD